MKTTTLKFASYSWLASAALLTACGGGGSSPAPSPVPVQPPVEVSTLVKTVPAPVYADNGYGPNSKLANVFNFLNAERTRCGFGALAQNTVLDKAAQNHAHYLVLNSAAGHNETTGLPGFTGVTPQDQVNYAGGASFGGQVAASGWSSGYDSTLILLSAPYHARAMLDNYTDMGVGYEVQTIYAPGYFPGYDTVYFGKFVVNYGYGKGTQEMGPTDVATYPCDEATPVLPAFLGEEPSPGWNRGQVGYPITVKLRTGHALSISKSSIVEDVAGATPLVTSVFNQTVNPNATNYPIPGNYAFVVPMSPLKTSTRYLVHIEGTNSGVAFVKDFAIRTLAYTYLTYDATASAGK